MTQKLKAGLNMETLNRYSTQAPSAQNAIDIFAGEWSSAIPPEFGVKAGEFGLFDDPRVRWAIEVLNGVEDQTVLELGPLEAGHTFMLSRAGAKHITAIEANVRAYLKCLIVKEVTKLQSAEFLFGDFTAFLKAAPQSYDIVFANGVLYHMMEPLEFLCRLAKVSHKVVMTTHYYDEGLIRGNPRASAHFDGTIVNAACEGYACKLYLQTYQPDALSSLGFCGGTGMNSYWMARNDIIGALNHYGFERVEIGHEDQNAANGPTFTVVAIRV